MTWRSAVAAAVAAIVLAGCGASDSGRSAAPELPADDAFVVRLYAQQQAAAALLRDAEGQVRAPEAKRLVAPLLEQRETTIAQLEPHRREVDSPEELADLGVTREQAAEDVTPTALEGVRPLDPAFLATMARVGEGTIALAKAEVAQGRDSVVKEFAQQLIVDQMRENTRINRALAALQQTA